MFELYFAITIAILDVAYIGVFICFLIGEYFKNPSGYKFPLMDTMNDLITGFLGSIACCLILIKTGKKYDEKYSKIIINKTPK